MGHNSFDWSFFVLLVNPSTHGRPLWPWSTYIFFSSPQEPTLSNDTFWLFPNKIKDNFKPIQYKGTTIDFRGAQQIYNSPGHNGLPVIGLMLHAKCSYQNRMFLLINFPLIYSIVGVEGGPHILFNEKYIIMKWVKCFPYKTWYVGFL